MSIDDQAGPGPAETAGGSGGVRANVFLRAPVRMHGGERVDSVQNVVVRIATGWISVGQPGTVGLQRLTYIPSGLVESVVEVGGSGP